MTTFGCIISYHLYLQYMCVCVLCSFHCDSNLHGMVIMCVETFKWETFGCGVCVCVCVIECSE